MNRLAGNASPYLAAHAHNPVDWYPWGDEALSLSKRENKPILLSIGYSACHWCHVMEKESFEDPATAKLMNDLFVSIKVDREERPDLDQTYQLVVQLLGRNGGWPLTVFLTPSLKPFFGGTYFPPVDKYGMPSFQKVLQAISDAYTKKRDEVDAQAEELTTAIRNIAPKGSTTEPSAEALAPAAVRLMKNIDDVLGGFGSAPKFPNTMALEVLYTHAQINHDAKAQGSVVHALRAMRQGGIYDQVGGGFHRYSTDEKWLVPHFEKMLYDNALLLRLYADAVGEDQALFGRTVREIHRYLVRDLQGRSGAFFSSEDADAAGEEGTFHVWSIEEIVAAVGRDDAGWVSSALGAEPMGNFEHTGKSVLSLPHVPVSGDWSRLDSVIAKMHAAREKRPRPFRDEKILTGWNALAIGALARASHIEPQFLETATHAFQTVHHQGKLARYFREDGAHLIPHGSAMLDDLAYLANAAIDLYEASLSPIYVTHARALVDQIRDHYTDDDAGGFFFTANDAEVVLTRSKDTYDHAVPNAQAMAALACLRLGSLLGARYMAVGEKALRSFAGAGAANPMGMAQTVVAIDRLARGSTDVLLVGTRAEVEALHQAARSEWTPHLAIAHLDPNDAKTREACSELAEGKPSADVGVAYVCRGRSCSAPIRDAEELRAMLRG